MGVNDKVRTDLDLYKGSNLGMGVYAIKRSYPKVGVCQIWKQYRKQLKNYAHLWKLTQTPRRTPTDVTPTGWQHLQGHSPGELKIQASVSTAIFVNIRSLTYMDGLEHIGICKSYIVYSPSPTDVA